MLSVMLDVREVAGALEAMEKRSKLFGQAAIRGVEAVALMHTRYTISTRLTEANPPYLNRKTGALAFSVAESIHKERATLVGDKVTTAYGTDKDYGYKHEVGGTFKEKVLAHTRRIKSRSVWEKTLVEGKTRRHKIATGITFVKEHTRTRTYRARHMFLHAMQALRAESAVPLERSFDYLLKHGKVADIRTLLLGTPGEKAPSVRRQ